MARKVLHPLPDFQVWLDAQGFQTSTQVVYVSRIRSALTAFGCESEADAPRITTEDITAYLKALDTAASRSSFTSAWNAFAVYFPTLHKGAALAPAQGPRIRLRGSATAVPAVVEPTLPTRLESAVWSILSRGVSPQVLGALTWADITFEPPASPETALAAVVRLGPAQSIRVPRPVGPWIELRAWSSAGPVVAVAQDSAEPLPLRALAMIAMRGSKGQIPHYVDRSRDAAPAVPMDLLAGPPPGVSSPLE